MLGDTSRLRDLPEVLRRLGLEPAALMLLTLLSGVWTWWAWQKGAYFGTVFLPGLVILSVGAGLLIAFAPWRLRLRLSTPITVTIAALIGLGCWELLSAVWSPAPDNAIAAGQRVLGYAIAFGLGVLLCNLLGRRMLLSVAPLAFAGAVVGLITAFTMLTTGNPSSVLETEGTLEFPFGYRNAEAAFFAICLFPALTMAIDRELDWRIRAAALAASTLCIDLIILAQSRASLPALLIAVIVFVLASPMRIRAASWLGLAALAAVPTVPAMTSLFSASTDGVAGVSGELHTAALITLLTTAAGAVLGGLAARNELRLPGFRTVSRHGNRTVGRVIAGIAAVGVVGFLVSVGNPASWIDARVDEFRSGVSPDLSSEGTRFGFSAGSDRYDAWRVALSDLGDDPIFGGGGGAYRYSYLEKRESTVQNLRDAHSVEFETLAEYGLIGFGLLAAAIVGAFAGAIRARDLGPSARLLTAAALGSGSYWFVHTSVDWFWPYPAIAAPVLALLGSAAAPAIRVIGRRSTRSWRAWAFAALTLLSVSTIAPYLAERYVSAAAENWREDPERALGDLDRAHDLNRFDDFTLLLKGRIQTMLGDDQGALESFREAAELRPEEYASHYLIAELEQESNLRLAQNEIRVALELNPLDAEVRALAVELGVPRSELAPIPER